MIDIWSLITDAWFGAFVEFMTLVTESLRSLL